MGKNRFMRRILMLSVSELIHKSPPPQNPFFYINNIMISFLNMLIIMDNRTLSCKCYDAIKEGIVM